MEEGVMLIQDLGVEVCHIPGGCTLLCQPVDIRFIKPVKTYLQSLQEEWMVER